MRATNGRPYSFEKAIPKNQPLALIYVSSQVYRKQ